MLRTKHIKLCEAIRDAGGLPYVVGGYVRDLVMGRVPKDVDIVVVNGNNDQVLDVLNQNGKQVGKDFPVFDMGDCQVALARTERKTGQGYTGFSCDVQGVSLVDDLRRRDLTINAMAMNPFTNEIIDPFSGRLDIQNEVLRAVGPHFVEDPLRVLRVARFAAQFTRLNTEAIDGVNLLKTPAMDGRLYFLANGILNELPFLPQERVFEELMKALRTDYPSMFFVTLDYLGALEILFPEIKALQGRPQPEKYHPEGDAYVHTLLVIDRARELGADDETMFAALTHDLGKAVTPDHELPHHYNHESLGVPLVHAMCDRLRVPNPHRRVAELAAKHHLNIHRFDELKPVKKVRLIKNLGATQDDLTLRRVALAAQADAQGRGPEYHDKPYPQRERLQAAASVMREVRGDQFAHLKDGRVIAQKMEQARAKALEEAGFIRVKRDSITT